MLILSKEVIEKLKFEYLFRHFYRKRLIISLLASHVSLWKQVSFVLIIVENYLLLDSIDAEKQLSLEVFDVSDPGLVVINLIQILLSFAIFTLFILKQAPYLRKKARDKIKEKQLERFRSREIKYKYLESNDMMVSYEEQLANQM